MSLNWSQPSWRALSWFHSCLARWRTLTLSIEQTHFGTSTKLHFGEILSWLGGSSTNFCIILSQTKFINFCGWTSLWLFKPKLVLSLRSSGHCWWNSHMILCRVKFRRIAPIAWVVGHSRRTCFRATDIADEFVRFVLNCIELLILRWLVGLLILFLILRRLSSNNAFQSWELLTDKNSFLGASEVRRRSLILESITA